MRNMFQRVLGEAQEDLLPPGTAHHQAQRPPAYSQDR
jgi:hypothetical protein